MTLYYVKPGATYINEALAGAAAMLEENKGKSIDPDRHGALAIA
jgi:hypothetical protein